MPPWALGVSPHGLHVDGKTTTTRIHAVRRVRKDVQYKYVEWPGPITYYLLCSYVAPCKVMYILLGVASSSSPLLGLVGEVLMDPF